MTSNPSGPLERAVVNMTCVFQGLKLALSKGRNATGVSLPSHEDRDRSSFRNVVFLSF
jgi:hypothetical protein